MSRLNLFSALTLASIFVPQLAAAAPPPADPNVPEGTTKQDAASSGKTELGTGDKFTTAKEVTTAEGEAAPE